MIEPEHFDDADEIDDEEPSGGRDDDRLLFDTEWELGEDWCIIVIIAEAWYKLFQSSSVSLVSLDIFNLFRVSFISVVDVKLSTNLLSKLFIRQDCR